jgi:hypothetical protein
MSRSLPPRPNLEHLRNQARELLARARAQHPEWQLADAQFALARSYGFSSWPALKHHVESMESGRLPRVSEGPSAGARSAEDESPMSGTWRANIDASARHPAFPFQSATLDIRVHGSQVSMAQVVVDPGGKPSGSTMTIDVDGSPHTLAAGGDRHRLTAHWEDVRTLLVVDTVGDDEVGRGRYEVSPDDRRLTVTTADQRIVFDRQ